MRPTYRLTEDGKRIDGGILLAFIHNGSYFLTPISIYADGIIQSWGAATFEQFAELVRSGWVVTQPPEGAQISVHHLGSFTATEASFIDPEEFIREIADKIEQLNGRPSTSEKCLAAWEDYQASPSDETKKALKAAYEAVPVHYRPYLLGDMDLKDHPIRVIVDPEHYQQFLHNRIL